MDDENKSYGYKRPLWQWIVIYVVIAAILYGTVYYLFLRNRTGYSPATTVYVTPTTQPTASPTTTSQATTSGEMIVRLAAENSSGESGTAVLKEENGKTIVTLNLTGFPKDAVQPTHIHIGACPGVGDVKYPLTNVVNGKSVTVLSVTLAQLKQQLPLAINVHKSAAEINAYLSCGELSSK